MEAGGSSHGTAKIPRESRASKGALSNSTLLCRSRSPPPRFTTHPLTFCPLHSPKKPNPVPWPEAPQFGIVVKICGVTCLDDALMCAEAGADALGFNFWPHSKRALPWPAAGKWIAEFARRSPASLRIAVLVQPSEALIAELASSNLFHALQFHGGEPPELCAASPLPAIRAAPAEDSRWEAYPTCDWLVDAAPSQPGKTANTTLPEFGGSGRLANWEAAASLVTQYPRHRILLAGGLNAGNVADAIRTVRPFGVDTASGVESAPGRKNRDMVLKFIQAARSALEPPG